MKFQNYKPFFRYETKLTQIIQYYCLLTIYVHLPSKFPLLTSISSQLQCDFHNKHSISNCFSWGKKKKQQFFYFFLLFQKDPEICGKAYVCFNSL